MADERHAVDAVPAHHSRLLKFSCFPGQHEPTGAAAPRAALQDPVPRAAESRHRGLTVAGLRQSLFAVIIQCLKEKHKRLVDFGRGPAREAEADLGRWRSVGRPAGRPGEDVTGWSKP